ncbi:MAG TPA: hypothetical protein PK874_10120 [Desulfobacteraceae bacterium]|nr:hypothetical protein [Desulfobacteraceae bacterium]
MEKNGGFLLHYCCSFNNSRNDLWVDHSIERPAGIINPAIIYVNVVIPAKAGIHNDFDWMPDQVRHDD